MADGHHPFDDRDILAVVRKLQSVGFCTNASTENTPRAAFDQVIAIFFDDIYQGPAIRQLPAMLGDGRMVDLFELHRAVRERGGYSSVTAGDSWRSVAEAIGFDAGVVSPLKLVYVKYLEVFERWLEKVLAKKTSENAKSLAGELELQVDEMEKKHERGEAVIPMVGSNGEQFLIAGKTAVMLPDVKIVKNKDGASACEEEDKKHEGGGVMPVMGCKLELFSTPGMTDAKLSNVETVDNNDRVRECVKEDKQLEGEAISVMGYKGEQFLTMVASSPDVEIINNKNVHESEEANGETASSRKRKREALLGMLSWVRKICKKPGDFYIGKIPPGSTKDKVLSNNEHYKKVNLAREAMFLKRLSEKNSHLSFSQKEYHSISSFYEDNKDDGGRRRFSWRLRAASSNHQLCSSRETSSINEYNSGGNNPNSGRSDPKAVSRTPPKDLAGHFRKDVPKKQVRLGSSFQVEVPDFAVIASESSHNSEELERCGKLIWPPENLESKRPMCLGSVGEGRGSELCKCELIGSVDCVRLHVVEKRLRLKRELGRAFYDWGFNLMGEEVSLSWTEEEEHIFKATACLGPSSWSDNFWTQLQLKFPSKKKQKLLSYYFNVFMLRRRSFQNRVTPDFVDSDEEEEEFGFASKPLGHDAINLPAKTILCAQNMQCMDLDD